MKWQKIVWELLKYIIAYDLTNQKTFQLNLEADQLLKIVGFHKLPWDELYAFPINHLFGMLEIIGKLGHLSYD